MSKIRLTSYTFDALAQTVVAAEFSDITLAGIQLIVNVTDQIVIYNFADVDKGGTLSTDTLTLEFDTTTMSDTDELMILVEDGSATQPVSGTITANLAAGTNNIGDVDILSIAAGDNNIGNVDVASIAAGDNNIGNVDIASALPAGTNNIGDVDVLTLPGVAGDVASGSSDSGNPVKVGAKYNSTRPTFTDGQRGDLQIGSRGSVGATLFVSDSTTPVALAVTNADGVAAASVASRFEVINRNSVFNGTTWDRMSGDTTGINVKAIVGSLPAGTAAIGKLAANSGVDIGDVDVTSLPRSQAGPGQPGTAIDSYTSDDVNLAANTADQAVVAAPGANKQIWVYGLVGTVDVAGSISIQDEDNTALSGVMPVGTTGGFVMNPSGNFSMPWIKVATNKALEIDTVTCTFDGIITYAIVSV